MLIGIFVEILLECKGKDIGVLVLGLRVMWYDVVRICLCFSVKNLYYEYFSFNWWFYNFSVWIFDIIISFCFVCMLFLFRKHWDNFVYVVVCLIDWFIFVCYYVWSRYYYNVRKCLFIIVLCILFDICEVECVFFGIDVIYISC